MTESTFRRALLSGLWVIWLLLAAACNALPGLETAQPAWNETTAARVETRVAAATPLAVFTPTEPVSPISIYFTDPFSQTEQDGLDESVAAEIERARSSVDMAIYNVSAPRVVDALIVAHQRGVNVRLVVDSTSTNENARQRLEEAGIPVLGDPREALMHNKFFIIDGEIVFTGSLNLTVPGVYQDANNLVRFHSPALAQFYTVEFEEMFTRGEFGPESSESVTSSAVEVDGQRVEVYFSPEDEPAEHILPLLRGAQHSIHFLAYSFTSDPLANVVLERSSAGVDVRGLMDAQQVDSNTGGEFDRFDQAGLDVRQDSFPGLMHHKVIIIDEEIVIFGSYNFSRNAEESNDENLVILFSSAAAGQFESEFERLFATGD